MISVPTFTADVVIGLQKGYSQELYNKDDLIKALQAYQKVLIEKQKIYLSANISDCQIVLSGQVEPHLKLSFINYPKFPLDEETFKKEVEALTVYLMKEFLQNRIVIIYHDETKMIEIDPQIDPRI